MQYTEFRRHLGKAGLSVNRFAALIDVRPSSVSNYAKAGHVPRTYAILAVLMGEAADRADDFETALRRFGIQPHAPGENVHSIGTENRRAVSSIRKAAT